jgi:hypothetical protein
MGSAKAAVSNEEKRFDPLPITRYFDLVNRLLNLNLLRNALLTGAAVGF